MIDYVKLVFKKHNHRKRKLEDSLDDLEMRIIKLKNRKNVFRVCFDFDFVEFVSSYLYAVKNSYLNLRWYYGKKNVDIFFICRY